MAWTSPYLGDFPRKGNFPIRVSTVYYCNNALFRSGENGIVCSSFEVSVRLYSEAPRCMDKINGKVMDIPFPNTVFKKPGMKVSLAGDCPRDTIAFNFDKEQVELLESWGLIPDEDFWEIHLTEELNRLVAQMRHLVACYTVGDMIDQLDWVCLQIMRELVYQRHPATVWNSSESRIKEAALYMLHRYDRELNCDEVASRFGFSHAAFFREWKRFFNVSPKNYVLEYRLQEAARRLAQTVLPVTDIVKEVHFSGVTAFYRKFKERYGVTPDFFRKDQERHKMEFPELEQNANVKKIQHKDKTDEI